MYSKQRDVVNTSSTGSSLFPGFDKAEMVELFSLAGMSGKQSFWLSEVIPKTNGIFEAALCFVIAEKSGPEMKPFDTTDEELARAARELVQFGELFAWNPEVEDMQ